MTSTSHSIAVIPGDLNGITVAQAAITVAQATGHLLRKPVTHTRFDYNADYFLARGITELGQEELAALSRHDQIFLGAIGDPVKIKPGVLEVGILLKLRQSFDQYVNLRPVVLPEGVPSILVGKTSREINFEILRENSEGLYVAKGRVEHAGTDDEVGIQEMWCSYKGVKRLAEYAVRRAKAAGKSQRPRIHFVFKTNVLTYAGACWQRVFEEYKPRADVLVQYMHIDNFMMQMLVRPEQFDVVITENMFGDIATDVGAVIQGGIGSAVSGNINPENTHPSMFEPVHGSAPDKWYETDAAGQYVPGTFVAAKVQQVRPEAALLSYAMMLEHIGEPRAATAMKEAALTNIRTPDYKTKTLDELVRDACEFVRKAKM